MSQWVGIIVLLALAAVVLPGVFGAGKVSSEDARALVEKGATLVDVRTPGEFAAGHIDGAMNIPVDVLGGRSRELPDKDAPIVVYCRSGARSGRAAKILSSNGYTNVHDLGAMSRW
jgi:rhodanese-related sulfurtransferase